MSRSILAGLIVLGIVGIALFWLAIAPSSPIKIKPEKQGPAPKVETLVLKGSNTVGESFAPLLARSYLNDIGAIRVKVEQLEDPVEKYIEGLLPKQNKIVRIDIRAHGSSTGFKALTEKSTEIAMSSRPIKDKEYTSLSATFGQVNEHPIALDALAIVTYPGNPVDRLSITQIAAMFAGEITNWNQIGGEDVAISLFSRDNNSGTWDTFKSLVLKPNDKKLAESSARFESSTELVNEVVNSSGSLGFVGVAYVGDSKLLRVTRNTNGIGTLPSGYTIGTQAYPLSRKLYLYTTGDQHSDLASSFINFVTQNEGQKKADEVGLISYYPTHYRPQTIDKNTPRRYRELAALGRRITVNFTNNQSKVDSAKEARDLERLQAFATHNPGSKIVLVDFDKSPRLVEIKDKLLASQISVLDTLVVDYAPRRGDNIEVWVL